MFIVAPQIPLCIYAFFILSCLLPFVAGRARCVVSDRGFDCMAVLEDIYKLHWTLQGDEVDIAMEAETPGWVGFAFAANENAMMPADAVIGWVDSGDVDVRPYYLQEKRVTRGDEDDGVTLSNVGAEEIEGVTIVNFTRALYEGTIQVDPEEPALINYAFGLSDQLQYHFARGSTEIVLADLPEEDQDDLEEGSIPSQEQDEADSYNVDEEDLETENEVESTASVPQADVDEDQETLESLNNLD